MKKMKNHSVLLGERPNAEYEHCPPLWKPSEIFIVDNEHTFDLFRKVSSGIVAAPRNIPDELELKGDNECWFV
jgi:hypothetical protein